jgi:hypothetical protein
MTIVDLNVCLSCMRNFLLLHHLLNEIEVKDT